MARQILVVDDERVSRLVTQTILEKLGYEVVVLDDGRGAADADASTCFDAIIMASCSGPGAGHGRSTLSPRRVHLAW